MERNGINIKLQNDWQEIVKFCRKFDRIHVFGAGVCAKCICLYLEDEKIHINDIIVSDGHRKEKIFLNKYTIHELSEIELSEKDGIIIALRRELQEEIYNMLLENAIIPESIYGQKLFLYYTCNSETTYFKSYTELDKIGCKMETDKCSRGHNYLDKYEFFLRSWRYSANTVLELGVFKGASAKMWSEYFENATIYGVDINVACKQYENKKIKVIIKDLGDEESLEELTNLHPQIIIDDASHFWSHQISALYHLLPSLESGGIYILEDLGTSFCTYKKGYYDDASVSAYDFCSAIAEVVCSQEFLRMKNLNPNLVLLKNEIEELASNIEMITFIHESCIIIKK